MIGIGWQPAGMTAAGLGAPEDALLPPALTGGARFISSEGDYVIDTATRSFARTTSARQKVQLAIQTEQATATADIAMGELKPTKIGTSFESDNAASLRRALQPHIDDSAISVDDLQVSVQRHSPGSVTRRIDFTDLQNQAADKANR